MRILLVEDDGELAQLIMRSLKQRGFGVDKVETLTDARHVWAEGHYQALVLDRMLPDGEGIELARELRRLEAPPPILILTAMGGAARRVEGLEAGADDYLEKPFDMNELAARLRALGRRSARVEEEILHAGQLSFEVATRTARTPEGPIKLSHKETILLEKLICRIGVTVLRDQLQQAVYGMEEAVTPNALEALISRFRKKLNAADAGVELHTMPGIGYLLKERAQ